MNHDPRAVANYFLERGEREKIAIDPLKLQKLVYFAHGWGLAVYDKPLLNEFVEAWKYGPVVPSLFHEFKRFGASPIRGRATELDDDSNLRAVPTPSDEDTRALLDRVWSLYKKYDGLTLSGMTHEAGSPWEKAWSQSGGRLGKDIPDEEIKAWFAARLKRKP